MFTGLLNKEVYFLANTITADGYGGQSVSSGTVSGGPYACRIRQLSESERDIMSRQGIDASYRLYCQAGITVLHTYTAKIDDIEYEVVGPITDPHFMEHHLQIDLQRKRIGKT
jgi:hypothetical protein